MRQILQLSANPFPATNVTTGLLWRAVQIHRVLFVVGQGLREISPRRDQPDEEEVHSAARVAGCTAISPRLLRRLHIAASSA